MREQESGRAASLEHVQVGGRLALRGRPSRRLIDAECHSPTSGRDRGGAYDRVVRERRQPAHAAGSEVDAEQPVPFGVDQALRHSRHGGKGCGHLDRASRRRPARAGSAGTLAPQAVSSRRRISGHATAGHAVTVAVWPGAATFPPPGCRCCYTQVTEGRREAAAHILVPVGALVDTPVGVLATAPVTTPPLISAYYQHVVE